MIQDIYPHRLNNEYVPDAFSNSESVVLCFSGGKLLCSIKEDEVITLPLMRDISSAPSAEGMTYLFSLDNIKYFLSPAPENPVSENFEYREINVFRRIKPAELRLVIITGYHLYLWYSGNRYCGRCGHTTVPDNYERMLRCPECGNMIFPRIMPSVIVGVIHGDQLLLTRYNRPESRLAALVAGFTEIGETAEETVRREVMEEVGLKVKNIRYYKSQPWGISAGGLLLGFWCDVDGDPTIHVDGTELVEAAWLSRENILENYTDNEVALTSNMIMTFARKGEN